MVKILKENKVVPELKKNLGKLVEKPSSWLIYNKNQ
jgi:hypothetical protein